VAAELVVPALTLILTTIGEAAAGEAGRTAWTALARLTRRVFGRDTPTDPPADEADIAALATRLVAHARHDPAFAEELRAWITTTTAAVPGLQAHTGGTINTISGTVNGPVVQTGNVAGNITFGPTTTP